MTDDYGNGINIEKTRLGTDLDVTLGRDLKWSEHVDRMVRKANRIQAMLKRTLIVY